MHVAFTCTRYNSYYDTISGPDSGYCGERVLPVRMEKICVKDLAGLGKPLTDRHSGHDLQGQ